MYIMHIIYILTSSLGKHGLNIAPKGNRLVSWGIKIIAESGLLTEQQEATLTDNFYTSDKWYKLRYRALRLYGNKCMCCGKHGEMHVDHVKPRSNYPKLELKLTNLQILCRACNLGKSNRFNDDWRPKDWKTRLRVFLNIKA